MQIVIAYRRQSVKCVMTGLSSWRIGGNNTTHDDVIKWKHFPRNWPSVRGIHRSQLRGASMFSLICVWINGWVNNGETDDLRRHRDHYDVNVMTEWKTRARSLSGVREYEQRYKKVNMQMARKDAAHRDNERKYNIKSMRMARKDSLYRDIERKSNKKSMKVSRKDAGYRDIERESNKKSIQLARKDQEYREIDRERNKQSNTMARRDKVYRDNERECNKKACIWFHCYICVWKNVE